MKTGFSIELTTGDITRTLDGIPISSALANALVARDTYDCEVSILENGVDVTTTILTGKVLVIGLRKSPGVGALLAMSTVPHSISGGKATTTLSLNTQEIVDLISGLSSFRRGTRVWIEFSIHNSGDDTVGSTLASQSIVILRDVNQPGDEPPATAAASATTAGEYAAQALASKDAAEEAASQTSADRTAVAADKATVQSLKLAADADAASAAQSASDADSDRQAAQTAAAQALASATASLASQTASAESAAEAEAAKNLATGAAAAVEAALTESQFVMAIVSDDADSATIFAGSALSPSEDSNSLTLTIS